MRSSPKWKAQPRRLRGRLGIEVAAQSPTSVVLPPLISPHHSASRHVHFATQQEEELGRLRRAFHERIATTRAVVDLSSLLDTVHQMIPESGNDATDRDDTDEVSCFSHAKRVCARLEDAPFLHQFLLGLVHSIEQLVHVKRQHESLTSMQFERSLHPSATQEIDGEHSQSSDKTSSDGDDTSEGETHEEHDHSTEGTTNSEQETHVVQDLRHARATDAVFRTTLRSRKFPTTRVPPCEYIQKTSSHLPFSHLKRSVDLASLRLKGHNEYGSAQWCIVLFPKSRPSLNNQDEFDAFTQWVEIKQSQLVVDQPHDDNDSDVSEQHFENETQSFRAILALKEHICFELSRFIFDKCPTTARFLHSLFVELVEAALLTLVNAEREYQIMEQRHKNVQLELSRLNDKLAKVEASLASVEDTLTKRQHMLLRERERIIRKRKKLNLLLGADQILIRRVAQLIYGAQEIGDDILQSVKQLVVARDTPGTGNTLTFVHHDRDSLSRFSPLDEIVSVVVDKYHNLPQIARMKETSWKSLGASSEIDLGQTPNSNPSSTRDLIVLDTHAVTTALEEYKATCFRLSRMMSTKSPDSSIGWDAQELWDQALFIPPHEDIQDLERDVQRLSLFVEERVLQRRQQRTRHDIVNSVAVQTEISACTPRAPNHNQRWRTRQHPELTSVCSSAQPTTAIKWNWRQLRRMNSLSHEKPVARDKGAARMHSVTAQHCARPSTRDDDHRNLLKTVVPVSFQTMIRHVPSDYAPLQLDLHQVHNIISYLFNGVWMLIQEDFHRPLRFSTISTTRMSEEARLIPLTTFHEYIYRIYLQHFHIESVVTRRILDLLLSASRLDTQSCKVQLFCKLVGLAGVTAISVDGFWFVLKSLHVLQRCCGGSGGYFLLDGEGDNEFIPQASATEAISQLFAGSSNEVLKRLRLKLSGLASVYGAVWIPAYNVLTFIIDEWKTGQDTLQLIVEEKLFLDQVSYEDPHNFDRVLSREGHVVSFGEFVQGFQILKLHVDSGEAVEAYRQLLVSSAKASTSTSVSAPTVDWHQFSVNWIQMILHAVNVSQQQILRSSNSYGAQTASILGPHGGAIGPGVQLGSISDAMVAAHQLLSFKFLVASWQQMKPEIIRRLDAKFNDVGLQVRLVQQMQTSITKQQQLPQQQRDANGAWRSFHHLIQIAFSSVEPNNASS